MADATGGPGSCNGIHGAVLEAGMGSARAILEAGLSEERRGRPDVGDLAPGAGQVQPRAAWSEERLRGCATSGEAISSPGTDAEFRAGAGTASVAYDIAEEVPVD